MPEDTNVDTRSPEWKANPYRGRQRKAYGSVVDELLGLDKYE